jgi:putative regulatory protein
MESITQLIGERIRIYRTKKGWTQNELAEKSGLHFKYIGSLERGEKVPSIDTAYKICLALKLPMEVLFRNIIDGDDISHIPEKFYNLTDKLSEREQKELYDLMKGIVDFHNHNK